MVAMVNWPEVQQFYDLGNSANQCCITFEFNPASWAKAVKRGDIISRGSREWVITLEKLLVNNRYTNTVHLKNRLIKEGILENKCLWCGVSNWRDLPIILQLDHINGDNTDNRLENLRLLCPNCHSQTETFCGKGKKLKQLRGEG